MEKNNLEEKDLPKFLIDVALCDFGMTGYIRKDCSLPRYEVNDYRDVKNIQKYPEACDIFSLGELLLMLIQLFHFREEIEFEEI